MRLFVLLITLLLSLPPAFAADQRQEILMTFSGVLKFVTRKQIVIEPEPDNEMIFVRTKRTRFESKGRKTNANRVPKGSAVSIDAVQKLNGELEAVKVIVNDAATEETPK